MGGLNDCREIPLHVIKSTTRDFDSSFLVGEGGFSKVYRALAPDSTEWAVKRTRDPSPKRLEILKKEVDIISRQYHRNLLKLKGFCTEQQEQILVYEYIPGDTLERRLQSSTLEGEPSTSLTFKDRLKIAIGVAKGLQHLHENQPDGKVVMHGDVKSSNILLNANSEAVVSDFGLTKMAISSNLEDQIMTRHLAGSFGYLDPDFFSTLKVTVKSDIFSFGVVLLELLTGKSAIVTECSGGGEEAKVTLFRWAAPRLIDGNIQEILDPRLRGNDVSNIQLLKLAEIARKCLSFQAHQRPNISRVLLGLQELQDGESREFSAPLHGSSISNRVVDWSIAYSSTASQGRAYELMSHGTESTSDRESLLTREDLSSANSTSMFYSQGDPLLATQPPLSSLSDVRVQHETHPIELFELGASLIYSRERIGQGSRDFSRAAALFLQAAEQGNAHAQFELAEMCALGLGVVKNERMCKRLHVRAAGSRFGPSMARCLISAWGMCKDKVEARKLYTDAANLGHAGSQVALGELIQGGAGFYASRNDTKRAMDLYIKAAEQDHVVGQIRLGLCYYSGKGVEKNQAMANHWFRQACRDNIFASHYLGMSFWKGHFVAIDYYQAANFFEQVIADGENNNGVDHTLIAEAHRKLGYCYLYGLRKGFKDKNKALEHLHRSADLGDVEASGRLRELMT